MKKHYRILAMAEGYGHDFSLMENLAMEAMSSGKTEPENELLTIHEGVGVIEVKGALTNKDSRYNSWYGLVSYNQIRNAAIEATELGVGSILFDIDSPGGTVSGMKDLSSFISTMDVPTISHTSSQMASAAYFTGISCEHCFADDMAESGSVGVVMTLMEYTEAMKEAGVHAEVFRSGKHKQAGNPYEKLSAENRKHIQDQVMTYADKFYGFVSEHRGIPIPAMTEIMTGKTFIGEEALAAGLIDKIMSFDEALAFSMTLAEKTLDKSNVNSNYNRSYSFNSSAKAQGAKEMPKKMSKQHLAALVSAGKEISAAPDASDNQEVEFVELSAEEIKDLSPEELTEYEAKLAETKEGSDDNEQTETEETPMVEASELVEMTEKFDASQVELAAAAEKIEALEESIKTEKEALETFKAENAESMKPMVEAICHQITSMRTALSLTSVDMTSWDAAAIMKEHASMSETFEKSFVVGGVVPQEGDEVEKESVTRADANDIKNLGF